jgi:hypothetical protein
MPATSAGMTAGRSGSVIASEREAIQQCRKKLDGFVAAAPRHDGRLHMHHATGRLGRTCLP